jgi:hypothetical protein
MELVSFSSGRIQFWSEKHAEYACRWACRSLFTDHPVLSVINELCKEDDQSSDIEMELALVESFENSPNSSMTSPCRKDEIPVKDLVMQEAESWDLMVRTALHVPSPTPKSQICCRESEFPLQISAAAHTTSEGMHFLRICFLCLFLSVSFNHLDCCYYYNCNS